MILNWPGLERSWYRWADRNEFAIKAILPENQIDPPMPNWQELILSWAELKTMPKSWESRLREWAGIYLICDTLSGKYYVGSAGGEYNLLGRWKNYSDTGHGDNKLLKGLNPNNFIFTILQITSPTIPQSELIKIEDGWKTRLHTRKIGLNAN